MHSVVFTGFDFWWFSQSLCSMQVQENVKAAIEVEQGAKYDEELLEEVEKVLQPVKNLTWSSGRDENN